MKQSELTGLFTFTKAVESYNVENLLVIHDKSVAAKYRKMGRFTVRSKNDLYFNYTR